MVAALVVGPVYGAFGDPFLPTCPFIDPPANGMWQPPSGTYCPTTLWPVFSPTSAYSADYSDRIWLLLLLAAVLCAGRPGCTLLLEAAKEVVDNKHTAIVLLVSSVQISWGFFIERKQPVHISNWKLSVIFSGWLLWSNVSTWPFSKVPGLSPSTPEDVLIPCGKAVLLDVPNLNLGLLNISGHLK